MNSHECAELARNEHPGIMKRGDTRFRPSKADRAMAHEIEMREAIARLYALAGELGNHTITLRNHEAVKHEIRQIAKAIEREMINFSAVW